MNKKKNLFSSISTMPSKNSLKWAGKEVSLLSNVILWTLWILRVFSLLQIAKLLYRKIGEKIGKATKDEKSTRINVPPMFCEIYYLVWFLVMLTAFFLKWNSTVLKIITYYYVVESVVWVLYYAVFRRFFEENYSIYHVLEYLTLLILVIPTQALAFANLYNLPFLLMLSGLLGAGYDLTPYPVSILGAIFAAIVISMIISSFPSERVKQKEKVFKHFIIGNGDVVKNRLYPALISAGNSYKNILLFDLKKEESKKADNCIYKEGSAEICEEIKKLADENSTVWIESPSKFHVDYLKQLISSDAELIVIEKPITVDQNELSYVEGIIENNEYRNKLFFLSYYILEKALPLYYLADHNPAYNKYLNIEDKDLVLNWRVLLGSLQKITVELNEGQDDRVWIGDQGGHFFETFIHNLLIASLFCGLPQYWSSDQLNTAIEDSNVERITLNAFSGNSEINLIMRKNLPQEKVKRSAKLLFSDGFISADFDQKTVEIYFAKLGQYSHISVKNTFSQKYSVITDLVKSVVKGENSTEEIDGLRNQIGVLKWLLNKTNTLNN